MASHGLAIFWNLPNGLAAWFGAKSTTLCLGFAVMFFPRIFAAGTDPLVSMEIQMIVDDEHPLVFYLEETRGGNIWEHHDQIRSWPAY